MLICRQGAVHPILCCSDPESSECITYALYVFSEPVLFRYVYLAIGAYNIMHTYTTGMSSNVVRCISCSPSARCKAESFTELHLCNLI